MRLRTGCAGGFALFGALRGGRLRLAGLVALRLLRLALALGTLRLLAELIALRGLLLLRRPCLRRGLFLHRLGARRRRLCAAAAASAAAVLACGLFTLGGSVRLLLWLVLRGQTVLVDELLGR